jgi:lactoylglutathione lyase
MLLAQWHASFHVSDIDLSVAFYRGVLGMTLVHTQDQANDYTSSLVGYPDAQLRVAQLSIARVNTSISGHDLELVQYVNPKGHRQDPARYHPGSGHLAFAVTDINDRYAKLLEAGVRFVSSPNYITSGINEGGAACYFLDPDEITLELVQPPPPRLAAFLEQSGVAP